MTKKAEEKTALKVLYLEDSPQDVELIRELLTEAKFELSMDCTAAEEEFVSLLRGRKYDIILADFKLSGFDAFAALRWSKEICPNVPLICVSGTIGEETAVELLKQGAIDYILKDKLVRLPSAIKRALDEAREKEARKLAEEVLRQSEARFRILFDQANDIILQMEITPEGIPVIRAANSATYRILGYERDELIGQPVSIIEGAPNASKVVDARRQNILSGIGTVFEARHRCKDGTILDFECSVAEMQFGTKTFSISVERDISERKRTEKKIKENLEEKEILLREIHHRVKNNLMVIYGLLAMQEAGKQHKDFPTLISDIKNRIFSMALIHESLYKSGNLTMIDPALYIQSLIANMSIALCLIPGQISFHQEVQNGLQFDMDTAAPLGLIFNELLTNAMKHAFPGDRTGEITIRLFKAGEEADAAKRPAGADDRRKYTLLVADNGVGLPKNWNEETTETMGTHLVQLLARQIAGSVAWNTEGGTVCRVDFSTKEK